MQTLLRTILWRNLLEPGLDYCNLLQSDQGFQLEGVVLQAMGERPARVHYQIVCDAAWQTQSVRVEATIGGQERALHLTVDDQQRWWQDGVELAHCAGLIDIDLGVTPATNTLPIRRLSLAVGERRAVTAAWVKVPDLVIQPLSQGYTRLTEDHYRYQSPDFQAELEVDTLGLVIQYGDWFERIATQS